MSQTVNVSAQQEACSQNNRVLHSCWNVVVDPECELSWRVVPQVESATDSECESKGLPQFHSIGIQVEDNKRWDTDADLGNTNAVSSNRQHSFLQIQERNIYIYMCLEWCLMPLWHAVYMWVYTMFEDRMWRVYGELRVGSFMAKICGFSFRVTSLFLHSVTVENPQHVSG